MAGIGDEGARAGSEGRIVREPPEEDVRVEEQVQRSSVNTSNPGGSSSKPGLISI